MANIRFLYFDLGNVLLKFSLRRLLHQVAELTETDEERVRTILFGDKKYFALESGGISEEEYFQYVCEEFGKKIPPEDFLQATNNIFWVNEPILPLIRLLSKELFPRGILSNTGAQHWRYTQEAFPCVWDLFPNHRIASFEVQQMKPFRPIYEIAFNEAKTSIADLDPDEVLFIDDLEENIAGACAFGFQGFVYSENEPLVTLFKQLGLPTPEEG